jgi:hypothetical protein
MSSAIKFWKYPDIERCVCGRPAILMAWEADGDEKEEHWVACDTIGSVQKCWVGPTKRYGATAIKHWNKIMKNQKRGKLKKGWFSD